MSPTLLNFTQFLESQTSSLSGLIFLLLFFGIIIALICILVINKSISKSKPISLEKKGSLFKREFSLPPLGGIITTFLIRHKWIEVNSISQIFLKGFEFLKKHLGENAVYMLPWYLVIGAKSKKAVKRYYSLYKRARSLWKGKTNSRRTTNSG